MKLIELKLDIRNFSKVETDEGKDWRKRVRSTQKKTPGRWRKKEWRKGLIETKETLRDPYEQDELWSSLQNHH
jgi:hypothetical protein